MASSHRPVSPALDLVASLAIDLVAPPVLDFVVPSVLEPIVLPPKPTAPIFERATLLLQVFNLTPTTQAITVPSTRTCVSTTIEMLFNGPSFRFLQFVDLKEVWNPLLVSCIKSMRVRKYANNSLEMTSAIASMEISFNQMRRMSHTEAIHALYGDMKKFKIYTKRLVECTAPDCTKVEVETEMSTGTGLTIGPGTGVVGLAADFNTVEELLTHHIFEKHERLVCSDCGEPSAESKITYMDIPDTFVLHINMRKVRYSTFLEVQISSDTKNISWSAASQLSTTPHPTITPHFGKPQPTYIGI